MASHEEILKGLESIDNPLVRQTIEYLINKVDNAEDESDYDVAKAAFLMYVHAAAPALLRDDVNVGGALGYEELEAQALESDALEGAVEEPALDAEAVLKQELANNGIYYFGPMDKHYLNDKRGRYNPHTDNQQEHGNRPGKRELVATIADARAAADEEKKKRIPRRVDMLEMTPKEVQTVAHEVIGNVTTSGGAAANPDAKVLPGSGEGGKNTTRAMRQKRLG